MSLFYVSLSRVAVKEVTRSSGGTGWSVAAFEEEDATATGGDATAVGLLSVVASG